MVADEGGVGALLLQELADQLVQEPGWGVGGWAVDPMLLHELQEEGPSLGGVKVLGELYVEDLLEARDHADASPGGGEVDLDRINVGTVCMVLDLVASLSGEEERERVRNEQMTKSCK